LAFHNTSSFVSTPSFFILLCFPLLRFLSDLCDAEGLKGTDSPHGGTKARELVGIFSWEEKAGRKVAWTNGDALMSLLSAPGLDFVPVVVAAILIYDVIGKSGVVRLHDLARIMMAQLMSYASSLAAQTPTALRPNLSVLRQSGFRGLIYSPTFKEIR